MALLSGQGEKGNSRRAEGKAKQQRRERKEEKRRKLGRSTSPPKERFGAGDVLLSFDWAK